ncbi:ribonuclease HII [Sulfuriroseicoccus oceanibius]|uniref:Ribonuclease HII n=1 Tax=Sulfuriroseicoccus oceanibius TaxID=2707525 RepID=A0A6B3L8I8_9BACT|nr:ribonuclease HII [Sulfuriroseicoccus oceanibius]QQL43827.1 ribonuclease HII [Sulfuriroseicoccus oceanibius]
MGCDFAIETGLRADGYMRIAGVDEAGRGPLAGPVSVAAVILPVGYESAVLNDSKKLTEKKRELLFEEITNDERIEWHCELIEPAEIDELNILGATHAGMRRCVEALGGVDMALIDGLAVKNFPVEQQAIVKGDGKSYSIAAASIIAKVTRDRLMLAYDKQFPQYGFARHKGYPTKAHMEALRTYGPCPIHRRSFAPVAQLDLPL